MQEHPFNRPWADARTSKCLGLEIILLTHFSSYLGLQCLNDLKQNNSF
jgi:hypothetical protein